MCVACDFTPSNTPVKAECVPRERQTRIEEIIKAKEMLRRLEALNTLVTKAYTRNTTYLIWEVLMRLLWRREGRRVL